MQDLTKTSDKHELLALMIASGRFTEEEIAKETGLAPAHIDVLRRSPLFQRLVERFSAHFADDDINTAASRIAQDARRNVDWLIGVRSGDIVEDPQHMRIQMKAAETLLDRQVPKQTEHRETGAVIVINADIRDRIEQARKTVEAIDVEVVE